MKGDVLAARRACRGIRLGQTSFIILSCPNLTFDILPTDSWSSRLAISDDTNSTYYQAIEFNNLANSSAVDVPLRIVRFPTIAIRLCDHIQQQKHTMISFLLLIFLIQLAIYIVNTIGASTIDDLVREYAQNIQSDSGAILTF